MATSTIAKLWVELGFKDAEFQKGVKKAGAAISQLNSAGNALSSTFGGVANKAVMALTGSMTAFLAATTVVGAKFDREMSFVGAITGATATEMGLLEDKARDLGKTTMYSATEAANAMQSFARVGMDTTQIIAASTPALQLAGAAGHDLAATTQTMAATMAQFNLEASEAGRISDVMGTAITNSLFDMNSLSEAMKYGGTVGKAFGMSLEQTTAAMSLFRNMGLEGSLAGTQFRMAMASAAKMSGEKEKVLKKLGITAKSISPEFNTFSEIMENLAKTTIGTGDALILFGRRAGANMSGLIEDFRSGKTSFYDMLDALETSTGATEQLYDKATNNVLDQFTIVQSAFQELLLTVFDSYKAPMMDLLKSIAEVLNYTATGLKEQGDAMKSGFTDAMEYATAYFLSQKEDIAAGFRGMITATAEFISLIVKLGPYLGTIVKTLIIMWAVGKVVAFTSAIYQVVTAIMAMQAAATAAGTSMAVAFAPLVGVVAVAAALAAVLALLAMGTDDAADSTERFASALNTAKKAQESANRAEAIGIANAADASTAWARATELQLTKAGELDATRARELKKLQEMSVEQKADAEARGSLIKVMTDQGEVLTSVRLLMHEEANETAGAAEAHKQLEDAVSSLSIKIANTKSKIVGLNKSYQEWKKAQGASGYAALKLRQNMEKQFGTIEKLQAQIHILSPALGELEKKYKGLTGNIEAAAHAEEKFRLASEGVVADKGSEPNKDAINKAKSAAEARIKLIRKLTAAEFKALNDEFAYRQFMLAREIEEVEAQFAAEARLHRRGGSRRKQIAADLAVAITAIHAQAAGAELEGQREHIRKLAEARASFVDDESDAALAALKMKYATMRAEEKSQFAQGKTLAIGNAKASELLELQHQAVMSEIWLTEQAATDNLAAKRAKVSAKTIRQIRVDNETTTARTVRQVQEELEKALLANQYASEADKETIRKLFASRRLRAIEDQEALILGLLGGYTNKTILLERERDKLLSELTEETEQYRLQIVLRYAELISAARRKEKDEAKASLESQGDWIDRFWDRSVAGAVVFGAEMKEVGGDVGAALKPGMEAAKGDFKEWLKWKLDHFKRNLENFGKEHPELAAWAMASNDFFKSVGKKAKEAGGAVSEKIGQGIDYAKDRTNVLGKGFHAAGIVAKGIGIYLKSTKTVFQMMLGGILKFGKGAVAAGKMAAKGVSAVSAAWSKALDALSTYLGFSFSITDGMERANELMTEREDTEKRLLELDGEIAEAQASGDASRLAELTQERNELNAALDQLPATHKAAAEAYAAEMVTGAVDTLDKMVESAPAMIMAMAEEAPRLVQRLVEQLPVLIEGLAVAIPQLMETVANAIPRVMEVLAESLPALFEKIFEMLPLLVTRLMEALTVLVGMVGEIVSMFILALPDILTAFFEQLPFLIEGLILAIGDIIVALVEAIPLIIAGFIDNLGPLMQKLVEGALHLVVVLLTEVPKLIVGLLEQIPRLIEEVLGQLPYMISSIISALPEIITAIVDMIPTLVIAVIDMIPKVITAIIIAIPDIIEVIIRNIPYIAWTLVEKLVWGIVKNIPYMVWEALKIMWQFFADLLMEIFTFGQKKTKTFGDTPGVQHSEKAENVGFAAGDYYAAARSPQALLVQALAAVSDTLGAAAGGGIAAAQGRMAGAAAAPGITGGAVMLPDMQPVVRGILEATDAIRGDPGAAGGAGAGGSQDIRVTVKAEGSVLDDVLYRAAKRGHAPKLVDMMKKASGVDVGMWRGGFADES